MSASSAYQKAYDEILKKVREDEGKRKDLAHAWLADLEFPLVVGLRKMQVIPSSILDRYERLVLWLRVLLSLNADYYFDLFGEFPSDYGVKHYRTQRKRSNLILSLEAEKKVLPSLDPSEIQDDVTSIQAINSEINCTINIIVALEAAITPFVQFPVPELVEEHKPRGDATEIAGRTMPVGGMQALKELAEKFEKEEAEAAEAAEAEKAKGK